MNLLRGDEFSQLLSLLQKLPNIELVQVRRNLLSNFPRDFVQSIALSGAAAPDLLSILNAANDSAQLADPGGSWLIIRLIENACDIAADSRLKNDLQELLEKLRERSLAHEKNKALALDELPPPGDLPRGSRMPPKPPGHFVGRRGDLLALARALDAGRPSAGRQAVVVAGMGGLGKTRLVYEFVHFYGQFFSGGVYWLNFAEPSRVPSEIAACAAGLGLLLQPGFGSLNGDEKVQLVRDAWQSPVSRLLVFDGCEDTPLFEQNRPTSGGSRVVVTSLQQEWRDVPDVHVHSLGLLRHMESIMLLRKYRAEIPAKDPELHAVAIEHGDLPLALTLAGGYLESYADELTPAGFLEELQASAALEHEVFRMDPNRSLVRTFELSYKRLNADDATDTLALQLLARGAYFAPGELLPTSLLKATLDQPRDDKLAARRSTDAVRRLTSLSLVEQVEKSTLRMHRLLAEFVRKAANDVEAQPAVERVVLNEARRLRSLNQIADSGQFQRLHPHLQSLTDAALPRRDRRAADLANELGFQLRNQVQLASAQHYLEQALSIYTEILGERAPETALALNYLGWLFFLKGDFSEARRCLERALAIRLEMLGERDADTAWTYNDLGVVLRSQEDYAEARRCFDQALAIRESVLGKDDPATANTLNDIGVLLQNQGDLEGAQGYLERALAIRQQKLGPKHPHTVTTLNELGLLRRRMGDFAAAQSYLEQVLAVRLEVLREKHPETAATLNDLGFLLFRQGDHAAALPYLERALAVWRRILGQAHPATAITLNDLGALLSAQGDFERAQDYLEQALAIRQVVLGPDSFETATTLNNLGFLSLRKGEYDTARSYFERALVIRRRPPGPKHRHTATTLNDLGWLLHLMGDPEGAQSYLEEALAIRREVLPENHSATATTLNDLGVVLGEQGDFERAQGYLEEALASRKVALGEDNLETAITHNNLGYLLYRKGDYSAARSQLDRALEIRLQKLGEDHQETAVTRHDLGLVLQAMGDVQEAQGSQELAAFIG